MVWLAGRCPGLSLTGMRYKRVGSTLGSNAPSGPLSSQKVCLLPPFQRSASSSLLGRDREEVRVTGVLDREDTDAEEATGGGSERDVRALVEVDRGLGEHGVVLELRTAEGRGVARDQDELGYEGELSSGQFPHVFRFVRR